MDKTIGLKAVLTATVAVSTMAVAPAQAATVGSVSFGGLGELASVTGSEATNIANIVFNDGVLSINSGTGDFAGYIGGTATFSDKNFSTSIVNKTSFVTFSKTGLENITFDLAKFIEPKYVEIGNAADTFGQFTSRLSGVFNPGNTAVDEQFSAFATFKQNDAGGTNNVANITLATAQIPTPALLPGLIGMGIAAWRKRKGETVDQSEG